MFGLIYKENKRVVVNYNSHINNGTIIKRHLTLRGFRYTVILDCRKSIKIGSKNILCELY